MTILNWLFALDASTWVQTWGTIGWLFFVLALLGFFPVSYLAYRGFAAETHQKRLKDDFRLLGLVKEDELDNTVRELYQTTYNPRQFLLYIFLIMLVSIMVLVGYAFKNTLSFITSETATLVFFGYLGAYVFSVQELTRRYNTFDLQPQVYSTIIMRMLVSVAITFVGSSLILAAGGKLSAGDQTQTSAMAWAAAAAFAIGTFPSSGIRWLQEQANRVLNTKPTNGLELSLHDLQGISALHEARLSEMGIDDVQNLATSDIRKILLTTRFDTQTIINWIDRAILYTKVGSRYPQFTNLGIFTFHEYYQRLNKLSLNDPLRDPSMSDEEKTLEDQLKNELMEERKILAAKLGLTNARELDDLADYSNYTNYAYIAEYYLRTSRIARQRASEGMGFLLGADIEEKDFKHAIEDLERRVRHNRADVQALVNLSTAYYGLNREADALKTLNLALSIDPNMATAYTNRARIHLNNGKNDEAVQDCTRSLLIDPRNKYTYNYRGMALISAPNKLEEALDDFNQAITLDQRFAAAYLNRGVANNARRQYASANRDFEDHYLLDGSGNFVLWLGWGSALLGIENYPEAIEKLNQAVAYEDNPAAASAYSYRGYAYFKIGKIERARSDLDTAIAKDPNLWDARENMGLLETSQAHYDQAIQSYQEILTHNPNRFRTRYNMAVAYYNAGQLENARAEFQKIIAEAPSESSDAIDAHEALAELSPAKTGPTGEQPEGDK